MSDQLSFIYSKDNEPHRNRTKQILKDHPEVRNLIGKNPWTIVPTILVVGLQLFMAYLLKDQAWYVIVLAAFCIGAFADHITFVVVHECTHNLLFKKKSLNLLASILANVPSVIPTAISFHRYHIKHHSFQGIIELDGDLPYEWEAKLVGRSMIGKAIWLFCYPVFQIIRTFRLKEIKPIDGWVVLNFLIMAVVDFTVLFTMGWGSIFYLFMSFWFSVGLHPLGGRWIQEHFMKTPENNQETFSYYGVLNTINMNIGYHNEHHDFPSIPWNNLPKLKNTAAEYYDTLESHKSWTKLVLRFLFDRNITLFSRTVRTNRGAVPLTDKSIPDVELINKSVKEEEVIAD